MISDPLTYFEIQKYYQNKTEFNGVYSRDNLSKIKDGVNIFRLQSYDSIMYCFFGFIDSMLKGKSYSIQTYFLLMNIKRMTK